MLFVFTDILLWLEYLLALLFSLLCARVEFCNILKYRDFRLQRNVSICTYDGIMLNKTSAEPRRTYSRHQTLRCPGLQIRFAGFEEASFGKFSTSGHQ